MRTMVLALTLVPFVFASAETSFGQVRPPKELGIIAAALQYLEPTIDPLLDLAEVAAAAQQLPESNPDTDDLGDSGASVNSIWGPVFGSPYQLGFSGLGTFARRLQRQRNRGGPMRSQLCD